MELAEKATALDPGFSDGYSALAFAQLQKQEPVAAIDSAEKAITTQPDNAFSRFIAGMVFLSTGQPDKALLHFQEALHLDPVEVQTPYLNALGIAYFYVKDYQSAIAALEKNKNRGGPLGPQSYLFLAASKARLGDESAARKIIAKLKQEFPTFPVHDWLASRTPDKALLQDIKNLMEQ